MSPGVGKGRTLVPTKEGGSAGCAPLTEKGPPAVLVALTTPGASDWHQALTATLAPAEAKELGLSLCRAGDLASSAQLKLTTVGEDEDDES